MSRGPLPSSWCDIHLDRISRNLELALDLLPTGVAFCAVMKADAYGHGISRVVPLLMEQGISCIGITSNAEAHAVRAAGFAGRLIRLRAASAPEVEDALPDRVEEQVGSLASARALAARPGSRRAGAGVHLALNSDGMSRDGLEVATRAGQQEGRAILDILAPDIVGICTHFPGNDAAALHNGSELFRQQVDWVCDTGGLDRSRILAHAGSTLTLVSGQPVATDMYRCGAILYGIVNPELGFRPSMELKSRVVHLGDYPRGASVGYDRAHRLSEDRRLACISIGYAAGYGRIAQDRGMVAIRGRLAAVLGKVSMNSIVADVTGIDNVQIGDEATLFGGDGAAAIGPAAAAEHFGTILADLFTDWGLRNARHYG